MGRSQETFLKKQREKNRERKKRENSKRKKVEELHLLEEVK